MNTTKEFISPDVAKAILGNNKKNRTLNREIVDRYARDMRNGFWRLTHQGLLIGKDGGLIDGQHRLHAIAKSGVGQWMLVTRDESLESALDLPIDDGNKRRASFINGISSSLAALAAFAIKVERNVNAPSASDIKKYATLLEGYFSMIQSGSKKGKRGISNSAVHLAGVTRIMLGEEPNYIVKIFYAMANDKFMELSPLAASFYKQVVVDRISLDQRQTFSRAIRVFDASAQNKTKLQVKDESFAYDEARQLLIKALNKRMLQC